MTDFLKKIKIGHLSIRAAMVLVLGVLFMVSTLHKNLKVYNYGLVIGCLLWAITITTVSKYGENFEVNLKVNGLEWMVAEKEDPPPPPPKPKPPKPDPQNPEKSSSSRSGKNHILSIKSNQGEFNV